MLKTIFKGTVKRILYFAGLFTSPRRIRILLYHSIDDSGSLMSTSAVTFRRQMDYIKKRGYHTISLSEFVNDAYQEKTLSKKLVVITFDDGFENNYLYAFPILKQYGFSATIFLTTDYINNSAKWIERDFNSILRRPFLSSTSKNNEAQLYKNMSDFPSLTWDEIKEMSEYGIKFGSHTSSHSQLCDLTLEKAKEDIYRSKVVIEKKIDKHVDSFAYPYSDFTPEVKQLVKQLGFSCACSGNLERNDQNGDMYDIRRISPNPPNSFFEFKFLFSSGFDWYIALKNKLRRWTKLK
jgi:peptidoglycan/xylan/chitin deacetylase (PgdA/CDA1 family)